MTNLLHPFDQPGFHAPILTEPWRLQRQPLLQAGLSIGAGTAGTAGLLLQDARGQPYLLTCFHVLLHIEPNQPVTQPAPGRDGGRFGIDTIGSSFRFQHPVVGVLGLDAALVILDVRFRHLSPVQAGTTDIVQGISFPRVGQRVIKSGRSTGVTKGVVEQFLAFPVTYEFGLGTHLMHGFRIVPEDVAADQPIATRGDSGAVWYDPVTKQAVGLLVSGRAIPPYEALACPLPPLLSGFNLPLQPLIRTL